MSLPSFLNIGREPQPADAIFVFAGRDDRKRVGLELFQSGFAPRLVLSVGRFEWRRFRELGLWSDGGLVEMVETIEAPERHFFVHVEKDRVQCEWVRKGRFGTLSEARALAQVIDRAGLRSILIVSSPEHLPRCVLALRTVAPAECAVIPVASAPSGEPLSREVVKIAGYGVFALQKFLGRRAGNP